MTILNHDYIKNSITKNNGKEDVPYRWSHGATDKHLGDGILIYSLIQFHKYKTLVCLGSGGGFIPRIMSQARYDLSEQGFYKEVGMEWGDNGSTYVVDACNKFNGVVDWEKEDSFFRRQFCPKFIKQTTEKAYYDFFVKQDIKIDLLHIDADHTFEGVKKDFDLYSKIMNKGGIITIHDTDKNYVEFDKSAHQSDLIRKIDDLLTGKIVNKSENQAAFHPKYRAYGKSAKTPKHLLDAEVYAVEFLNLCWNTAKDKGFDQINIISIGIGGSYEGSKLLLESLNNPIYKNKPKISRKRFNRCTPKSVF